MKICESKSEMRAARGAFGGTVGLVPTMGYLHDGHMELVRRAKGECECVIATIFVNPTQFGPNEDFATYPRDIDRDVNMLRAAGVDALFLPDRTEMYHPDAETVVEPVALSKILIGKLRPGHFRGVATIVIKLLNIVQPDAAFFGQKDYQQLAVIRRVVRDLDIPVRIVGVPIQRDADGLALSSRNVRLSEPHRAAAPVLNMALDEVEFLARQGVTAARLRARLRATLSRVEGAEIASIDIRDAETLAAVRGVPERPVVALLAVRFGDVLLIDNRVLTPEYPA